MDNNQPSKWRRLPKVSFNSKDLSRRMKKVEGATVKHARRFVFKRWSNFREVRRRIALWTLSIGLVIGAAGLQFMWYQDSYRTSANAIGGTYAEAVQGPLNSLNPIFASTSAEEVAGELLFSRLLNYDKTGNLNFDLADSMKVSEDGKTYTLTIRPDAQWSDGPYIRARDVVFTVNLVKNAATRSTITGWSNVKAEEIDDRTVSFQLPAIYAAFPHALRFLPILPEHTLRDTEPSALREATFNKDPITSGPFSLRLLQDVDPTNGRKVAHLIQNKDYFGGMPKLDRVQLHVYKDADSIKRALATAEVNATTDLSVTDAASLNLARYVVENRPVNAGVYALFNTTTGVLQEKAIRHALQVGTDTAAVRKEISENLPALPYPLVDGQLHGDLPALPVVDVAAANKILDDAGWVRTGNERAKDGQKLALNVVTTKNSDFEKALQILSTQWRTLGITVTTTVANPADPAQNVTQDILQPRHFDVLLYQLTIGGDPDVYAYWHSSQATGGYNFSNYKNAIADEALLSARTRVEPELRNAKYLTFTRQWVNDAPAIGLYQPTVQYVHTKNVHALPKDYTLISGADRFGDVGYWTVGSRTVFTTP